jgi:aconitate hydratase
VAAKGYPANLRYALIGSCTNSSYEDMSRAAAVAKEAAQHGLKAPIGFMVTPGSEQVHQTINRDGQMADLQSVGANVLANACGPCIGQWKRDDIKEGERNSIITSFNRNFPRRNDGNAETLAFIASPEIVTAFALAGRLDFNPLEDELTAADGSSFKLAPPPQCGLPLMGFSQITDADLGYVDAAEARQNGAGMSVAISDKSDRLQVLSPFARWTGVDFSALPVLLKSAGKCTTDHISPAGPWLKYRGHLDRISDNMFLGANNAFAEKPGTGINVTTGAVGKLSDVARDYKRQGMGWVVVGDQNYGEGSSREHAAMSPRFLGCKVVIARSFARIHETNLKHQGVLPLTFSDPAHYELVKADDRVTVRGLSQLAVGQPVEVILIHGDGSFETISANHTLTTEQIGYFKAGSALNFVGDRRKAEAAKVEQPADKAGDKPVAAGDKRNPACKCKGCACGDKKGKTGGTGSTCGDKPDRGTTNGAVPPGGNGNTGITNNGKIGRPDQNEQSQSLLARFWRWLTSWF